MDQHFPTHICFVCLGNICRSPLAEGVFKRLVAQAGLDGRFHVESAGMGAWHVGEPPDPRSQSVALAHGIRLDGTAQQFKARGFARFDRVIALDADIASDLRRLAPGEAERRKIHLLREYDPQARGDLDVPDPYYGGREDFERVYQMIERSCRGLLEVLRG